MLFNTKINLFKFRSFLVLALLGALVYSIIILTQEYLYENVTTKMTVSKKRIIIFPAISICHKNPMIYSKIQETGFADLVHINDTLSDEDMDHQLVLFYDLQNKTRYIPEEVRMKLSYNFEDIFMDCIYDHSKKYCNQTYFKQFFNIKYGNCYTYNSALNGKDKELLRIYKPGKKFGLQFIFKSSEKEFLPSMISTAGIIVLIHSPFQVPHELTNIGLSIAPGHETSISLTKKIRKSDSRVTECAEAFDKEMIKDYPSLFHQKEEYSFSKCIDLLFQTIVREMAGCCYVSIIGCEDYPHLKSCDINPPFEVFDRFNRTETLCKLPCNEEYYDKTVTTVKWPTESHFNYLMKKTSYHNGSLNEFRETYGKVNIYFSDFDVGTSEEIRRFTALSLISSYGGYAGLYVGISFFSLFAFAEKMYAKMKLKLDSKKMAKTNLVLPM